MSVDFIDKFKTILANYPNVSNKIIIEISEYHLVNNLALLKPVLYILKAQGITMLSDKVGQYVVSSQYLKECPISSLKLHRSIVLDIQHKPENQTVIQSLKAICAPLDINIYALGVENEDEWQMLKKLGVNGGQGHFFTKPVAQAVKAIH
jgi:RNase E specificity factor CsrD